jgi:hypothetical protein
VAPDGSLHIADQNNHRIRRVVFDSTPPEITPVVTGALGNNGWYVSDVTVNWDVQDPESAITSTSGCEMTEVLADTLGTTFTCTATSAGGTASESVTIMRDARRPTIQATTSHGPAASGWYNIATGAPTVSFSCSDDAPGSGLDGPCPDAVTLGEGENQSVTRGISDRAGNMASVTVEDLDVDLTPPSVVIATPPDGAAYLLGQAVASSYSCSDTLSGIATCVGPVASGANINTATVGSKNFTVNATDQAGNPASRTHTYDVHYMFNGFLPPIDNLPVVNVARAGRTYPVKWQLKDAVGNFISSLDSFSSLLWAPIACDAAPEVLVEEEAAATGATTVRYDATTNQFIFNWQTSSTWRGCYVLQLELNDGSYHYAKFNFK